MMYLRYAWAVMRHKCFVLYAGLRIGAPIGRLITHDMSKFGRAEFGPYARKFYSGWRGDNSSGYVTPPEWWDAFHHHVRVNDHHWEHWHGEDMSEGAILEMVADWFGAGRAYDGKWQAREWYKDHRAVLRLSPITRLEVERVLQEARI